MRRVNKKREKIFAVNYKIAPELLQNLDQMTMLANSVVEPLKNSIIDKGYTPISKAKIIPYSDISANAESDLFQISIKAVYIGKKKAREEQSNDIKESL
jgi:hypothetical protein